MGFKLKRKNKMIKTRNSRKLYEDAEDLDKIYNAVDKIVNSPKKFRDDFDELEDFIYDCGIDYYFTFEALKKSISEDMGYDYVLDILLDSLREYPNDNKPLAKGNTDCYCVFYNDKILSYADRDDSIESIRQIIITNKLLDVYIFRSGYNYDDIFHAFEGVL